MDVSYALSGLGGTYRDGRLIVDFEAKTAYLDLNEIDLTPKEFELLAALARSAGRPLSRSALLESVWEYRAETRSRTLDEHIRRLRLKLGSYGRTAIQTVSGFGYRLQPPHPAGDNDPDGGAFRRIFGRVRRPSSM